MRRGRESHAVHLATWDSHLARINGYTRALRLTSKLVDLRAGTIKIRSTARADLIFLWHPQQEFAPSYELPTGKDGAMIRT